jgi:hypothetical protein
MILVFKQEQQNKMFETLREKVRENYPDSRRRFNFYAGLVLPHIAITSGMYFGVLKGNPIEDPWYVTIGKTAFALGTSAALFLPAGALSCGLIVTSNLQLREKAEKERKSLLEQQATQ